MSWDKKTTDTHNMNVCESLCTSNPKTLKKKGGGGEKIERGKMTNYKKEYEEEGTQK